MTGSRRGRVTRPEQRRLLVRFVRVYAPGALCLLVLLASFDLHEGGFDLDSSDWTFRNRTNLEVEITPLYSGKDGIEHVVPRAGWEQTQFKIASNSERTIRLKTGDFPFERILVETQRKNAWTIPVQTAPVDIVATGVAPTPKERAAQLEPTLRRLKLYSATATIPLLWTVPVLVFADFRRRRRESRFVGKF
jgi:hypothetical protein